MPSRVIATEDARDLLLRALTEQKLPFTCTVTRGKKRSVEQNKLQRLLLNEIAEQLGDRTAEEVRAECKLTIGVPILRAENDDFCEKYDRIIRPLPYETKLELMAEPLDFPVTRLMTMDQKSRYLDAIYRTYSARGIELTEPL